MATKLEGSQQADGAVQAVEILQDPDLLLGRIVKQVVVLTHDLDGHRVLMVLVVGAAQDAPVCARPQQRVHRVAARARSSQDGTSRRA